jgi:hypothetical protein
MTYTILNMADSIEDPTDKWPQSEPDARDFGDILAAGLNLTGVVSGCAVTAQGSPDMTVAVASGVAIVGGTSATVTAGNVTIGAAGAQPRFDLICVSSAGVKSAVAGTGATNPVFADPAGKAVLAAVYVPASDTDIDSNQIVDKRVIIKPWAQLSGDTFTGNIVLLKSASEAILETQGDGQGSTMRVSAWGNTSATVPRPAITLRRFRGTVAAPLRTKSGDSIGVIGGTGATAASDVAAGTLLTSRVAQVDFRAAEDFTATANGSEIRISTIPLLGTTLAERIRIKSTGELQMDDISGFASNFNSKITANIESTNRTATISGGRGTIFSRIRRYGGGIVTDIDFGLYAFAGDHSTAAQFTITNAANNGSGLIRITATGHSFATGDRISIGNVAGVTNANGTWTITKIDANTFDLQASTFAGVYSGSGSKATSAGSIYGVFSYVQPTVTRVLSSATGAATDGDDVSCFAAFNGGTVKGMECFYVGSNAAFAGASQWTAGLGVAADVDYGVRLSPACTAVTAGIQLAGTVTSGVGIDMGTGLNIKTDTGTGMKIGTATNEKIAFHNSTPVVQATVTGSRGGNAALASLLTALAAKGLIADGSSA